MIRKTKKYRLDDIDYKIIQILKEDGRMSFVDIGKKVNASEGKVRFRVNRMISAGVIRRFTIDTAGGGLKGLIDVRLQTNHDTSEVAGRIIRLEGVKKVYEVSGEDDIVVVVEVEDTDELNTIVEGIRRMGVISTRTRLILKEH